MLQGDALGALSGQRVLLLNWRDPAHPQAGGAEVYTWELARRMSWAGVSVTLFTSRPAGLPRRSRVDGVEIIRQGDRLEVYARAAAFLARHGGEFDAIVDFQNGIPFFAPLFAPRGVPVVCTIHHVHQEQFGRHFGRAAAAVGRWLEAPGSRWIYRHAATTTISPSTRAAVRRSLGFRGPLYLVPVGAPEAEGRLRRADHPTITVVSRLVTHKQIHLVLDAVPELLRTWPDLRVHIVGDGPDHAALMARLHRADHDAVTMHGYVNEETKTALLAEAWLTVNPSAGEGWGLNVMEANALGVPTVAFDVPGLCDSVVPGRTGWLVPAGRDLGPAISDALEEVSDGGRADAFAADCRAWCSHFDWDDSTQRLAAVITSEIERQGIQRRQPCDLSCVAEGALPSRSEDGEAWLFGLMAATLRRTDLWHTEGGRFRALLYDTDEQGAMVALRRAGLDRDVTVRVARSSDLLAPHFGDGAGRRQSVASGARR